MDQRDEPFELRRSKLAHLRELGVDPYPARFRRTHTTAEALAAYSDDGPPLTVSVAGRLGVRRDLGKMSFAHIQDGAGRLQLQFRRDLLGDAQYALLDLLDYGDFIGASGELFRTNRGEVTVRAERLELLSKSLRNPPEKWHGLADVEKRYRQRYLDLVANPEVAEVFRMRSRLIARLRQRLEERGFIEVETPVLQAVPGGGAARPFETFYNALDEVQYLRIALELHLKRCIIGGLERVFEIGRIFRNEGLSAKHNPEFTMLELYQAYADYADIMRLLETVVCEVAVDLHGSPRVVWGEQEIDFSPPWHKVTLREAILGQTGLDIDLLPTPEALYGAARAVGLRGEAGWARGKLIDELLSQFVEPKLIQPTFLLDYPLELSPLAKQRVDRPDLVERFEAFAGGMEIANAYSELNDPLEQRARFEEQSRRYASGDPEAQRFDADFLEALEHGMPPTGGLGVGIDRLVMLMANQHTIRDVLLFPQLRSLAAGGERRPAE